MIDVSELVAEVEFDIDELDIGAKMVQEALRHHDVVSIVPIGDSGDLRSFYDRLAGAVEDPGPLGAPPSDDRWSAVRYVGDSNDGKTLHTDETACSTMAGEQQAPHGGETVFVDGQRLVEHLQVHEPELFVRLRSTPVSYAATGELDSRPIVTAEPGQRPTFGFDHHRVDPNQPTEALVLDQDFSEFCVKRLPADLVTTVVLKRGQAVAWKDPYVLHGHAAVEPHRINDRVIWRTGLRWSDAG